MLSRSTVVLAVFGLIFAACGSSPTPAGSGPAAPAAASAAAGNRVAVSIKNLAFNPNAITVTKGGVVTWTNDDGTPHTSTSGTPGTKSGKWDQTIQPGTSFAVTFNDAGTFPFFCNIHNTMTGTVTVR